MTWEWNAGGWGGTLYKVSRSGKTRTKVLEFHAGSGDKKLSLETLEKVCDLLNAANQKAAEGEQWS